MISSIEDIIELHKSEGEVSDAYVNIHLDDESYALNIYSLRVSKGIAEAKKIRQWNIRINEEVKKNRNLYKEVREFNSLFELFKKCKVKNGYIIKSEVPDFIYIDNENKKTGIEVTKIYVGNDWVAERLSEEIEAYKLRKKELEGYLEYKRYKDRIRTYNIRGGIAIVPVTSDISIEEYIIEIKNKIFEKIRKLVDDYQNFEDNIIYAEIISPEYFKKEDEIVKLSEELQFFINHIEWNFDERNYLIILKTKDKWIEFNLKNGTYKAI